MDNITNQMVLVLDMGGRHKELAARAVRSLGVYSEIRPKSFSAEKIRKLSPIGIVLAGKPEGDENFSEVEDIPVFEMPDGNIDKEALHTFLFNTCGAAGDYSLEGYINAQTRQIKEAVGNDKILLALSGGVDSSVCAALLSRAVPNQLTCIFVDHGFMRLNEGDKIETAFAGQNLNLIRVNAQDRFLSKVAGVSDPEKKRKIIGEEFIAIFEEEAKKLGGIPYFAQGTIYADIVESGGDYGEVIKSHHNVGGMPEKLGFDKVIEPLAGLFKDEVRALGRALGLPANLTERQPLPGPGLAVRVMGEITFEKLETLRQADAIATEEIERHARDTGTAPPSQYFALITNTLATGIKNHKRTYNHVIALRSVLTEDFITAQYAPLPHELLGHISAKITSEVPAVSRVVYDITSKPPGAVEWE